VQLIATLSTFTTKRWNLLEDLGGGNFTEIVIQQVSANSVHTSTESFDVESTLRGGHIVRIRSLEAGWSGLYRCGDRLLLVARCQGTPPFDLPVSNEVRAALTAIIDAMCSPSD
jgi:hypothetical protein